MLYNYISAYMYIFMCNAASFCGLFA